MDTFKNNQKQWTKKIQIKNICQICDTKVKELVHIY